LLSESDLHKSLMALASRDNDASTVHALSKLGETHENLSVAEYHKAEMIAYQLESPLKVGPLRFAAHRIHLWQP
jgi:hypothetical protein